MVAAVERYLARRGLDQPPAETSAVVDRFLAAKRVGADSPVAPPPIKPAAPGPLPIVDFVCEDDVRRAVSQSKKIYVGPASIITPSARDLALQHDVLVMTDQKKAPRKGASE